MAIFEFIFKGRQYSVEGTQHSLKYIVLPDARKVIEITEWTASLPPAIAGWVPVKHDMQESLPAEIAEVFNAAIATRMEPKKLEIPEEE
jgi:hypothetical protein